MVKMNKRRCNGFSGEVQKASPLAMKNTQEYRDVIAMVKFKLSTSVDYLEEPFDRLANSIKDLWLSEGDSVPGFATKFFDYWSVNDYATFCEQVKQWALDHGEDPFEELRRRVRELIMCDKKSLQLLTITKLLNNANDDEKILFAQQANVQQLCNEIGDKDDQIFVESNDFKNSDSQFERLKSLIQAMRLHSNYLVNQRYTRRRLASVNAEKEANFITKPIKSNQTHSYSKKTKAKDHDDELEM